ncbi:ArsR family transcriptional regulator [Leucobacter sp. UCD-THU]|jgi:DNA-binding transcriptional ArsR family regulator|uniref:ArsR/SmtB family transcription factor n=2 Tax=Leucobacter TaxID=55968 RepID=UPI000379789D|nr:metalloregulator ArsR/SmtB family transcription factor [Leucobacter sp. UCD-THU]EYT54778.1 ArsR family transcriptional regulator [Leucobacter sp. UCD-THU]
MHALDILGDPVRRRILELIADGEESAGDIAAVISEEFGISQPAVSQHLRVLREHGFASVRPEGTRRLYAVDPRGLQQASAWLTPFERFWRGPFAALGTELARGKRQRRLAEERRTSDGCATPADAPSTTGAGARPADSGHHQSEE